MEKSIICDIICKQTGEIRRKSFENCPANSIYPFLRRQEKKLIEVNSDASIIFEVECGFYDGVYRVKIDDSLLKKAGIEKAEACYEDYEDFPMSSKRAVFNNVSDAAKFIKTLLAA